MTEMLNVKQLNVIREGRQILDSVSLSLESGEAMALVGPNGSGKTTLIRSIIGLIESSGEVFFLDKRIDELPTYQRSRVGIGYLPQHSSIFLDLSVRDNLVAVLSYHRKKNDVEKLLERFGLEALKDQKGRHLSGGEKRRVELARLWALEPRLILLDEPFVGLDPSATLDLQNEIKKLQNDSISILIAEHRVEEALTISQRVCILVDGRVIESGDIERVAHHPIAYKAFFGPLMEASRSRPWD